MRIALAQINPTVGDIAGNGRLIERFTQQALEHQAHLVVFPELAISGYPPRDLLYQEGFLDAAAGEAKRIGESCSAGITLVFGVPLALRGDAADSASSRTPQRNPISNSLLAYRDGKMLDYYDKRLLPTYDVFDEDRYFMAGRRAVVIEVPGASGESMKVGLSICEDLWKGEDAGFSQRYVDETDPVPVLIALGARLIVNPSASPFVLGKGKRHRDILRQHAMKHGVYVAAVNQVGGNDELVFDGHAAVFDPAGQLLAAGKGFEEQLVIVEVSNESVA
ncbi:MAG: NAD+ synthase, partial [Pyrinomonadaceae bacterium]|nr:NAD+ synthase [Phycisphaerales bacterium]